MTRSLIAALQPERQGPAVGDSFERMPVESPDNLVLEEYPRNFCHLLTILIKSPVEKLFANPNPDGYFYLLFIRTCIIIFLITSIFSGTLNSLCYLTADPDTISEKQPSWLSLLSPVATEELGVYYLLIGVTALTTVLVTCQLSALCNEMANFKFQPDLQLRDQFIKLHTLMIKGINKNVPVHEAQRTLKKVFQMRFDRGGLEKFLGVKCFKQVGNLREMTAELKKLKRKRKRLNKGLLQADVSDINAEIQILSGKIAQIHTTAHETNLGIAFIAFKDKDCVRDTLDEMDLVKVKLSESQ